MWLVACEWGKLHITWMDMSKPQEPGWACSVYPAKPITDSLFVVAFKNYHVLGFYITNLKDVKQISIPFYFPTTISAALLWFAWRKTRLPVKGRAFPVEVKQASGEDGGKAE